MLLPAVIERELRTAARRPTTYWARLGACVVALTPFAPVLVGMAMSAYFGVGGIPLQQLGPILFTIATVLAAFTSVAAGWFFAADAVSHERREGTLELLFLAPLKPIEVIFGKFATASWRGAQWILAIVPLFAFPLLLGGVAGSDFAALALLGFVTLLWSASTSLWASSVRQGVFGSLVLAASTQAALIVVPYAVDFAWAGFEPSAFVVRVSRSSPFFAWTHGFGRWRTEFWTSLGIVHLQTWLFFGLAVVSTARLIRQNPSARAAGFFERLQASWTYGRPRARSSLRRRLLEQHPIRWLVERERGPIRFLIAVPLALLATAAIVALKVDEKGSLLAVSAFGTMLLSLVVNVLLAVQATRYLLEARKTGALELMLVSPVASRTILAEHSASLARTFLVPIVVIVVGDVGTAVLQWSTLGGLTGTMAGAPPAAAALTSMASLQWIGSLAGIAVRLTGYLALIWVGFWMGLVGRHVSIAVFATLALAKLGPALASSMAQSTLMSFVLSGKVPAWTPLLLATVTGLGINLGLVALARHQLLPDLRRLLEFPGFVLWPTRSPTPPVLRA